MGSPFEVGWAEVLIDITIGSVIGWIILGLINPSFWLLDQTLEVVYCILAGLPFTFAIILRIWILISCAWMDLVAMKERRRSLDYRLNKMQERIDKRARDEA